MSTTPEWSKVVGAEIAADLQGDAIHTLDQVAARVGSSPARISRLWMALGFPVDPAAEMFTEADVSALKILGGLVSDGVIDDNTQLSIARTLGHSTARLAEWQVDVVAAHILQSIPTGADAAADVDAVRKVVHNVTDATVPALGELQDFAWRRHFAVAASRSAGGLDPDPASRELVVGFADMVGYTQLTRHLSFEQLTQLIETFESGTAEVIAKHNGWVIKNLGDEVMFAAERPIDAARIAFELHELDTGAVDAPELRVGMAAGPVLQRLGDLYGSVVNVAARLTGVARPGTVLVDAVLGDRLDDEHELIVKRLRPARVRGFSRLDVRVLRREGSFTADRTVSRGRRQHR
ncbi:adenylate/guanylate cyclase domain-containing protein [Antrihabitans sp. YC3-6]|uniref:Adenylate/guanylate cyclase domain-containing protein n=1 Tax=Antrihabitans stalagmiti TaxID=2799499 RepID=A0A934NWU8_9NOCA|nr:adenylate/guanylate cyclase domain-containing protein [Antrihabitans stalagmiti]MBJ8342620.1 adenylate/guanylate cyclase domain-containing protein [Antrihabitans stalagmiti]